jgi:MYXO-CTERM domain-containing protein
MSRQLLVIATLGTAAVGGSAEGGFLGFVALAKQSGSYVFVDVYVAVGNSSDKFLNVYNTNISTTNAGGFYQQPGFATKTWKPDAANFNSTRSSIDSFMTAGTYSGAAYGGEYYASTNTNGDPNFTGTSWSGTPASAAATTIPANAGWYTGDPTSVDNGAQLLAPLSVGYTRFDSAPYSASGNTVGSVGSANATYGVWCSHLVLANTTLASFRIDYSGSGSIKDGVTGATGGRINAFIIPAPGAIALLGVGGIAVRRRRH